MGEPGLNPLPPGGHIEPNLSRPELTPVLGIEQKVDERVGIVHPAHAENDVGVKAGHFEGVRLNLE
jgi:hypothetical protein